MWLGVTGVWLGEAWSPASVIRVDKLGAVQWTTQLAPITHITDLIATDDGGVLVMAYDYNHPTPKDAYVTKLAPNGRPDSTYNDGHLVSLPQEYGPYTTRGNAVVLSDGRLVLCSAGCSYFMVLLPDGTPDLSVGKLGLALTGWEYADGHLARRGDGFVFVRWDWQVEGSEGKGLLVAPPT